MTSFKMVLRERKYFLCLATIAAGWTFSMSNGSINENAIKGYGTGNPADSNSTNTIKKSDYYERRIARSVSGTNCNSWAPWVNDNHPSHINKEDQEVVSPGTLTGYCPVGTISKVECKDNNGEPFSHNQTSGDKKYFKVCMHVSVSCIVLDNTLKQCPDMSVRYYCSCTAQQLLMTRRPDTTSTTKSITTTTDITLLTKSSKLSTARATLTTGTRRITTTGAAGVMSSGKLTDGGEADKQASLQIGSLAIPWWAFVLLMSGILFIMSVCVSVCLYKKATNQIQMKHTNKSVHPLNSV